MEFVTLNNGVQMPLVGYGTYNVAGATAERHVTMALEAGYRAIDTAQCYHNEKNVGKAIAKSGISRDQVFVTAKTWSVDYASTKRSIDQTLRNLGTDYVDLLLVHEPAGDIGGNYTALEDAYREGKARAIGVSNFIGKVFQQLVNCCTVIPAVNQVETHVYRQQHDMQTLCASKGTVLASWSPLCSGEHDIFKDPALKKIAAAHGVSVAQVALRALVQRGIPVVPKSKNAKRMRQNLDVFGFALTDHEMARIATLDERRSLFNWY
ncbi:MAG: aldo/keto reductase [Eggerthellaceae bacterium]|nr:aldo/keto reductase [Eggerthellaceae bacterium]